MCVVSQRIYSRPERKVGLRQRAQRKSVPVKTDSFLRWRKSAPLMLLALLGCGGAAQAQTALTFNTTSQVAIVVPQNATLPEQTAAAEIDNYLTQITGGNFTVKLEGTPTTAPAIYVGDTAFARAAQVNVSALAAETWRIKASSDSLILAGKGTRGTLYAAYNFLENNVGVRWWNPWEESVPSRRVLAVPTMNKTGKPTFNYRDIYTTYGNDSGRFAIRNRLNRDGDSPISASYGGSLDYGPPYHVHTMYLYLSPQTYHAAHPDWFFVPGSGFPTPQNSQLAMSNPAMRQEFLRLLRINITNARAAARSQGLPEPDIFDVSQEDSLVGFNTGSPADTQLLQANGGAESAILLDFVNYLADGIKVEFPTVSLTTLAYYSGERAPTVMRPRANVIIRLTDTPSNMILPISAPRNHVFRDNILAWKQLTLNLRVWDYSVLYDYPGLPVPTSETYAPDFRFMLANGVKGVFTEHEYPILADMRDFKVWLQCKLFENPNASYNTLLTQFTNGFYGAAGTPIRNYINALHAEARRVGDAGGYEDLTWGTAQHRFNYLSLPFVLNADATFATAAYNVRNSPVLSKRVRHARMPLDRYIALYFKALQADWYKSGNADGTFPFNIDTIADRYLLSWNEQIAMRLPAAQQDAERLTAEAEVIRVKRAAITLPLPLKFRNYPRADVFAFEASSTRNFLNQAKLIADPSAEGGIATRLLMSDVPPNERAQYQLPMGWGIYDTANGAGVLSNSILPQDVPGPGYNWYKMGETTLPNDRCYLYFFWSWNIQLDLQNVYDAANPSQRFEVWANLKFEGPNFPGGNAGEADAISVERVVLHKVP